MEIGLGEVLNTTIMGARRVLILVLVEIGLGERKQKVVCTYQSCVLILVLVEIGLGDCYYVIRY